MLNSTWDNVNDQDERIKSSDYTKAAKDANIPVPASPFEMVRTTRPRKENTVNKRTDPALYPLEKIEVKGYFEQFAILDKARTGSALTSRGSGGYDECCGCCYDCCYDCEGYDCEGYDCGGYCEYDCGEGYGSERRPGPRPRYTSKTNVSAANGVWPITHRISRLKLKENTLLKLPDWCLCRNKKKPMNSHFKMQQAISGKRDTPNYMFYEVYRSELSFDGTWSEWATEATFRNTEFQIKKWAFSLDQVAAPEYLHPLLTSPSPPIVMHDGSAIGLHSEVPKFEPRRREDRLEVPEEEMLEGPLNALPSGLPGGNRLAGGYGNECCYDCCCYDCWLLRCCCYDCCCGCGGGYGGGYGNSYADLMRNLKCSVTTILQSPLAKHIVTK